MQPYDYNRGLNNNNTANYNNQNNANAPINNPFLHNNDIGNNNNMKTNEGPYNAPTYYNPGQHQQQQQQQQQQGPPLHQGYQHSGVYGMNQGNYKTNNIGENMYNQDGHNNTSYINQGQPYRNVTSQFIPVSSNNTLKAGGNMLGYDNMGNINHVQPIINDTYQEFLQFNAFSHFVKSSVSYMPANTTLKQKAYVPLGFVIQPLAPIPDGYPELASVNFGNSTVVRCKKM